MRTLLLLLLVSTPALAQPDRLPRLHWLVGRWTAPGESLEWRSGPNGVLLSTGARIQESGPRLLLSLPGRGRFYQALKLDDEQVVFVDRLDRARNSITYQHLPGDILLITQRGAENHELRFTRVPARVDKAPPVQEKAPAPSPP
jgi:hypothetical protein